MGPSAGPAVAAPRPMAYGGSEASGIVTPRTLRTLKGRRCWVPCCSVTFSLLYVVAVLLTAFRWSETGLGCRSWWCVSRMYICTFISALGWVVYLWYTTTTYCPVPLGLLVSVWFTAGTVSVSCCSFFNHMMVRLWAWLDPYCYITYPADNWPWDYTSLRCILLNVVQWILTAGIIEESFKFLCLLRLRPTLEAVEDGIKSCRCRLPGSGRGWWMKLADSRLAYALCGVAAGGGLATTENFMYIFSGESIEKAFREGDLESAYGRIAASFAHMTWTGYAACGLAKYYFLPPGHPARPERRASYLLTPIVLHGVYNWCSTLQRCEAYEETYEGQLYKSDGCYLPPNWRMIFKLGHTAVMLASFYWWHNEFSDIVPDDPEEDDALFAGEHGQAGLAA